MFTKPNHTLICCGFLFSAIAASTQPSGSSVPSALDLAYVPPPLMHVNNELDLRMDYGIPWGLIPTPDVHVLSPSFNGGMPGFHVLSPSFDGKWIVCAITSSKYSRRLYYFFDLDKKRFEWQSPGVMPYATMHDPWTTQGFVVTTDYPDGRSSVYMVGLDGHLPRYLTTVSSGVRVLATPSGKSVLYCPSDLGFTGMRFLDIGSAPFELSSTVAHSGRISYTMLPLPGDEGFVLPFARDLFDFTTGVIIARKESGGDLIYRRRLFSEIADFDTSPSGKGEVDFRLFRTRICSKDRSTMRFLRFFEASDTPSSESRCSVWDLDLVQNRVSHVADLSIPIRDRYGVLLSPNGNWVLALADCEKDRPDAPWLYPAHVNLQRVGEKSFRTLPITVEGVHVLFDPLRRVRFINDTSFVYLRYPYEIRRYSIEHEKDERLTAPDPSSFPTGAEYGRVKFKSGD